ncbi:hypothetical protein BIFGAL_02507 [Bifidobacterium gallicum DSM 20093 = LMG 11596]|uniref:Uncharacterized protein n=1 Tax=Bifidobacterium gallicum DSM 20093 = LMG 11596 TaxID=561180 RepID=D1NRV6_9BIFI|nr:hypothetical protein BIFGAL_02507 [Bifidobacterium gallicum DSM 20093 = LMG 11596]
MEAGCVAFVPRWYVDATDFASFCTRLYHGGTNACILGQNPYRRCTTVVRSRYKYAANSQQCAAFVPRWYKRNTHAAKPDQAKPTA